MQHNVRFEEQFDDRIISEEILRSCRNHIETLQNLSYLTSSDAADSNQVRLNVKMMEWHLLNLTEALVLPPVLPPMDVSKVSAGGRPAKPQVTSVSTTAADSNEDTQVCEGEFRIAPDRTIWSALVNVADDARLHRLHLKAHRMLTTAKGSTSPKVSLPNAVSDWKDFSIAVEDEENRRLLIQ
jgi:hypothetical protein